MKSSPMKSIAVRAGLLCLYILPHISPFGTHNGLHLCAEELFELDIDKLKDDIERYIVETEAHIDDNKIREARQVLELLEEKVSMPRSISLHH